MRRTAGPATLLAALFPGGCGMIPHTARSAVPVRVARNGPAAVAQRARHGLQVAVERGRVDVD